MGSLLHDINKNLQEQEILAENIQNVATFLSLDVEQLNEAVTTWLAKVRNVVSKGTLDPNKKESVAKILGALLALSNPDLADALDEEGDIGTTLYNVSSGDKVLSNAALQKLLQIGNHPSVKSFVQNVMQSIDDPQALEQLTKKIQVKIEPVMNRLLKRERMKQQ